MPNGGSEEKEDGGVNQKSWEIKVGKDGKVGVTLKGATGEELSRRIRELADPKTPAAKAFQDELLRQTVQKNKPV